MEACGPQVTPRCPRGGYGGGGRRRGRASCSRNATSWSARALFPRQSLSTTASAAWLAPASLAERVCLALCSAGSGWPVVTRV
eukprot:scaffold16371_cov95-Isochrysis_galbana.AAC.3